MRSPLPRQFANLSGYRSAHNHLFGPCRAVSSDRTHRVAQPITLPHCFHNRQNPIYGPEKHLEEKPIDMRSSNTH